MTHLPVLHFPALCRDGGDVCGDYVDDGRGGCRYFGLAGYADDEGAFAVPLCALAEADEPSVEGRIAVAVDCTPEYTHHIGRRALARLGKRARLMRLHEAIDVDPFVDTRKPIEPEEEPEERPRDMGNASRVVEAMRSGLRKVRRIADAVGLRPGHVSSLLCHMANRGEVRRVAIGEWVLTDDAPVQFETKEAG